MATSKGLIGGLRKNLKPAHPGLEGVLATLFRKILNERTSTTNPHGPQGITEEKWREYLADFVANAKSRTKNSDVLRSFTPGGLAREFEGPTMTWRGFVKALRCIRIKHLKFAITLTGDDGIVSAHSVELSLGAFFQGEKPNAAESDHPAVLEKEPDGTISCEPGAPGEAPLPDATREILSRYRQLAELRGQRNQLKGE